MGVIGWYKHWLGTFAAITCMSRWSSMDMQKDYHRSNAYHKSLYPEKAT